MEAPAFSSDVVVEVRSPSVDVRYLAQKIARYLATGSLLVLDVDPQLRTIVAQSANGVRTFSAGERFESAEVEWLHFEVAEAFSGLDD